MNKAELVDAMAEGAGISKADAKRALDAFVDATAGALGKGDRVSLVGFGSFSVSHRGERQGRNPQTGKAITIKAKNGKTTNIGTTVCRLRLRIISSLTS